MKAIKSARNLVEKNLSSANSAWQALIAAENNEKYQRLVNEINRQNAETTAVFTTGAEASVQQIELLQKQVEIGREQNAILFSNYKKLEELYDAQVQESMAAKEELKRSGRYNRWMMAIAIAALLVSLVGSLGSLL